MGNCRKSWDLLLGQKEGRTAKEDVTEVFYFSFLFGRFKFPERAVELLTYFI